MRCVPRRESMAVAFGVLLAKATWLWLLYRWLA
jgi:hypothetical protein